MPGSLIHHLTSPGQLTAATVVCGARDAALATWNPDQVTCPQCQRPCTCGPGIPLCPAGRAWNAAHRSRPTSAPALKTEKQFQAWVQQQAVAAGFLAYHTLNSRGSAPGFPDLVVAKAHKPLLMIELKMDNGRLTTPQQQWMDVLHTITHVESAIWRPQDQEEIIARLSSML